MSQESDGASPRGNVICYHRTRPSAARAILAGGFDDAYVDPDPNHWVWLQKRVFRGVWFSSHPLDAEDMGADPTTHTALLRVDLPADVLAEYELAGGYCTDTGVPILEWCVPTAVINARAGLVSLVETSDQPPGRARSQRNRGLRRRASSRV
jgi:hypothetical protein